MRGGQGNQIEEDGVISTPFIVNKATATFRASLGSTNPQHIWAALGLHLETLLKQGKAARIIDFGTFGFNQDGKPIFLQDPVFLHMTRLSTGLRRRGNSAQTVLSSEKVVDVNAAGVAAEGVPNCSNDLVNSVISSVMAWVITWAKDGEVMRVSFLPVGEWICTGERVDFRFLDSFCDNVAKRGSKDEEARIAEPVGSCRSNQFEELDEHGDRASVANFLKSVGKLGESRSGKSIVSVATSNQEAETRSRSSTTRSQYKMRASTRSTSAKQRQTHIQRPLSAATSTRSSTKTARSKTSSNGMLRANKQGPSSRQAFNPAQIEAVAHDIIEATTRPKSAASRCLSAVQDSVENSPQLSARQVEATNRLLSRISRSQSTKGLNALIAVFITFKSGTISQSELSVALRKLGIKVSAAELKEVAAAFAHRNRGYVETRKLIEALRGPPMSPERLDLVERVYRQMDPAGYDAVSIDEMIKFYNVSFLPQVRDGKQTRLEALNAFLQDWSSCTTGGDNVVTFDAFAEYYHNVSPCIADDAEFARLMQQTWKFPDESLTTDDNQRSSRGNHDPLAATSAQDPDALLLDQCSISPKSVSCDELELSPQEGWTYLRALLLPRRGQEGANRLPTLDNMCRRLRANRVLGDGNETMNFKAFAHALSVMDKRLQAKQIHDLTSLVAAHCGEVLSFGDTISLVRLHQKLITARSEAAATEPTDDNNYVENYASRTIGRIRAHVFGSSSDVNNTSRLNSLEKALQLACSNRDAVLARYELRSALQKIEFDITYQELDYLFAYFDADRDGFINYDTFLEVLGGASSLPKVFKPRILPSNIEPSPVETDKRFMVPPELPRSLSPQCARRPRLQIAKQEDQPNFRRRNVIHRTVWNQTKPFGPEMDAAISTNAFGTIDVERRRRYRAAQMIQSIFRGVRCRQVVAQLRRKTAARDRWMLEGMHTTRKITRTALPNAYGF